MTTHNPPIGIGYYSIAEAARLLHMPAKNIHRWLRGYTFTKKGKIHKMPPLWAAQIGGETADDFLIGFRDLIELRFVNAFTRVGLNLITIRACLEFARKCVEDDHPFSTRRFRTDGKTIFLEGAEQQHDPQMLDLKQRQLDLKQRQYVIARVIEQSFKDLDIDDEAVARWRPYRGKSSIVVDPERSFGQPVASKTGIPTITLSQAVDAEESVAAVSRLFEVSPSVVRDAVAFERQLMAA